MGLDFDSISIFAHNNNSKFIYITALQQYERLSLHGIGGLMINKKIENP
jgi:hypothetical protein